MDASLKFLLPSSYPATSPHGAETLLQVATCVVSPHGSMSDLSRDQQCIKPSREEKKKGIARFNFTFYGLYRLILLPLGLHKASTSGQSGQIHPRTYGVQSLLRYFGNPSICHGIHARSDRRKARTAGWPLHHFHGPHPPVLLTSVSLPYAVLALQQIRHPVS
jgi:hypothetical protein